MGVYHRAERWMVYFWENGKRHDRSFGKGETGHVKAMAFDEAMKNKKESQGNIAQPVANPAEFVPAYMPMQVVQQQPQPQPVRYGITLVELADKFVDHLKASGSSTRHVQSVSTHFKNQFLPVLGNKFVDSMSYANDIIPFIRHYQEARNNSGKVLSRVTINRYTDYLNAMFNFGITMGLTSVNPVKGRKKTKERPREVQITLKDVKKIMAHADTHVAWAIEVCFNLGLRPGVSELFAIKYSQIDWDKSTIKVYATKTKTYRTLPITSEFLKKLKKKQKESKQGYVIEYHGKPVERMNKAYQAAVQRAGITVPTRMYDLRHLYATTMLTNGADLAAVSKLMGHSTITMTADTYYQYMVGEKERAVSLLPSLG